MGQKAVEFSSPIATGAVAFSVASTRRSHCSVE